MKLQVELRTVSRNGQVALPKRFLEALGVLPLAKVQVIQEKEAIVIRKSSMTRMSDKEFMVFLKRIWSRNAHITQKQVAAEIRKVRRQA